MSNADGRSLRYEIKMIAQGSSRRWIETRLRFDESGIRTLYPDRRVQSVYFDDLFQSALHENLAGISHREKIRFRWYGDGALGVQGKLERKVRHNLLGWKDIAPVGVPIDVEGAERHELTRAVFSALPDGWHSVRDQGLMPAQWIAYRRAYFTTADGRIRITVDRDLRTCDLRHRRVLTARYASPLPDVTIVEAKCGEDAYREAKALLNQFPLVIDKCSKFVLASQPGGGPDVSILQ